MIPTASSSASPSASCGSTVCDHREWQGDTEHDLTDDQSIRRIHAKTDDNGAVSVTIGVSCMPTWLHKQRIALSLLA
jgi:hypothetical protein